MIPRRSIPVHVIRKPESGEHVTITYHGDGNAPHGVFSLYSSDVAGIFEDDMIAESWSAKRLSDWAFEHGAFEVRHDYDLKLSDGEP